MIVSYNHQIFSFMQYRILHSFLIILALALSGCFQDVTEVDDENGDSNGNGNGATPPAEFSQTDEPGESNEAFVTGSEFDELIIEIQFMEGMEPAPETLEYLENFLDEHLEKSDITILEPEQISSSNQTSYSRERSSRNWRGKPYWIFRRNHTCCLPAFCGWRFFGWWRVSKYYDAWDFSIQYVSCFFRRNDPTNKWAFRLRSRSMVRRIAYHQSSIRTLDGTCK